MNAFAPLDIAGASRRIIPRAHPAGRDWAASNTLVVRRKSMVLPIGGATARLRALGLGTPNAPSKNACVLGIDVVRASAETLSIDLVLSEALLEALSAETCPTDRPVDPFARALAAEAALDAAMSRIESAHALRVLPAPSKPVRRTFGWHLSVEAFGHTHAVALNFDADALPVVAQVAEDWDRDEARHREVRLAPSARLGRMAIPRTDVADARPGDVLLPPRGRLAMDRATLVLGGDALARLSVGGATATVKGKPMSDERKTATTRSAQATLNFSLPCAAIAASKLCDLVEGSVIALEREDDALVVDISLDGRPFGQGEIVSLGGRLGVEILDLDDGD